MYQTIKPKVVILVIDDSTTIIDRIVPALSELPNVKAVHHGNSIDHGVRALQKHRIDVAVVDINLKEENGIELLKHIRAQGLPLKVVIMMTQEPTARKEEECRKLGADYYIDKFNDLETIFNIIAGL